MKKHIIQSVKTETDTIFEVGEQVKHQGAGDQFATIESFEQLNSVEIRAHTTQGYCNISYLIKAWQYTEDIPDYADVITVEEFEAHPNAYDAYNGSGYWVKDGLSSRQGVHKTPKKDATHVAWYNK